jgi:hypothetical protein
MILNMLDQRKEKYLLLALTGVAAQNIGGRTIHSALHIRGSHRTYLTLAHEDPDLLQSLKASSSIVIDEVSMVSAELLTFISNMFGHIHENHHPFGGKNGG